VVADSTIDTRDKEMGIVALAFNFAMRDDHEDYPALKLANYMFGENMNSRLMNRIREKEGISYGGRVFFRNEQTRSQCQHQHLCHVGSKEY
jgi:predicted Zn-dependent peptidase